MEQIKIIVFDCETTGLPKRYDAPADEVENWPRITQLAYNTYQGSELIKRVKTLIKPDGWAIPTVEQLIAEGNKNPNFFADNNMSTERCQAEGRPISEVMTEFVAERLACDIAVAHNISFDGKICRAEMIRLGMGVEFTAKKICTMQKTTNFCKIPKATGNGFKWPTLTELHQVLFNSPFDGAHDAGGDVEACAKCFFELINRGIISLS